jgi:hypothetical protein
MNQFRPLDGGKFNACNLFEGTTKESKNELQEAHKPVFLSIKFTNLTFF